MKKLLSIITVGFSILLTACSNSNSKEAVELLATPAAVESQIELAEQAQKDTKEQKDINNIDDKETNNIVIEDTNKEDIDKEDTTEEQITNITQDENQAIAKESTETAKNNSSRQVAKEQASNSSATANAPVVTKVPEATKAPAATKEPTKTVEPTKTPTVPTTTKAPTPTVAPTSAPKAPVVTNEPTNASTTTPTTSTGSTLSVKGTTISLGESKSSVTSKLGSPNRTDVTEYNYQYYVYNSDYKKFLMVAIANDVVVGWYTDATDFSYKGLSTSSNTSTINSTFGTNKSLSKTMTVSDDGTSITFFMDTLGNSTIDGIYVASSSVSKASTTKEVVSAWEREVLDLTNSFRARNELGSLAWSNEAAISSRKHSADMVANNYFDHTSIDGRSPFDRMAAEGISYRSAGENIIAGYGNALYSTNGWVNSSGHRSNLLSTSFTHLGVGYALGGSYGDYATQNFFRK